VGGEAGFSLQGSVASTSPSAAAISSLFSGIRGADSPRRFSALKTLTPEHRVDFSVVSSVTVAIPAASSEGRPPGSSPKASEAVDSSEDDYVMLDAADLVLPLNIVPVDD
jgi:hypothetical protein